MVKVLKIKRSLQVESVKLEPVVTAAPIEPTPVPKKVLKLKKTLQAPQEPVAPLETPPAPKKIIKLKKVQITPVPPPPPAGSYLTPAMETFEAVRLYCANAGIPIPEEEIKAYYADLEREKKEFADFWDQHGCSVTWAGLHAAANGQDIDVAICKARLTQKKEVITEDTIGEMPSYGTPEFWAWCRKRKQLRLQKEAAIIAAGGTVKEPKSKGQKKAHDP